MRDEKLTELIQYSIEQTEAREREAKVLAEAEQIEFNSLMACALAESLADIVDMPQALIPYCNYARGPGCWDRAQDIETLKKGWRPSEFIIRAPALSEMRFSIHKAPADINDVGRIRWRIRSITVEECSNSYHCWSAAITEAARIHRRIEQWRREQEQERADRVESQQTASAPTDAEQLAALIEQIVIRKVSDLMEV
jgi:hypothetical protein